LLYGCSLYAEFSFQQRTFHRSMTKMPSGKTNPTFASRYSIRAIMVILTPSPNKNGGRNLRVEHRRKTARLYFFGFTLKKKLFEADRIWFASGGMVECGSADMLGVFPGSVLYG
jgi:hypothetical protein